MKSPLRNNHGRGLALLAFCLLLAALPARAQINYQGRLTDSTGANLADGAYSLKFSLWDDPNSGSQLWGPYVADGVSGAGHGALANVVKGQFNVVIGAVDTANRTLNSGLASAGQKYLQIQVGSSSPILPRQAILAAPRALFADQIPNVTPVGNVVTLGATLRSDGPKNTFRGMLETSYGDTDRYGIGAFANAILGIYTSDANTGSSIQFGRMTGANSFVHQMAITHGGNVGIGTTTPSQALEVIGNVGLFGPHLVFEATDGVIDWTGGFYFRSLTTKGDIKNFTDRMMIASDGNVGIGTTTPTQGKLVVNGGVGPTTYNSGAFFDQLGAEFNLPPGLGGIGPTSEKTSIYASDAVHALLFRGTSDERIKLVRGVSDALADLQSLLSIQITDYTYKDVAAKGNGPQKKVIAQQVEKVFPQAVSRSTDVVPDIYQKASVKDGWVQLATDLKAGDRVRLIGENAEGIHEVLEARPDAFRTAFKPTTERVFVYGREVKDFRSVDYEAISMLNVSATQELARKLAAAEQKSAVLEQRLAEQSATAEALQARLGKLEQAIAALQTRPFAAEAKLEAQAAPVRHISLKQAKN